MHNNIALESTVFIKILKAPYISLYFSGCRFMSLPGHHNFSVKKQDNIQKFIENILHAQSPRQNKWRNEQ